jgi:N-formylmaleamate deformylase
MRSHAERLLLLLALTACAPERPTPRPPEPTAAPAAARAEPAAFSVRVVGSGPPMILIPGLTCSGEVWNDTVAHYHGRYQAHIVTLAGFAGQPAIGSPFMPRVRDELVAYIRAQGLVRPVIVGHSLGGFMALWIAATAPDEVGPVVAVDGVPFLAALGDPAMTPQGARPGAEQMRTMMASLTPEQFAAQTQLSLSAMITDPKHLAEVEETSRASDPAAVGEAVYELMTTDIRPLLAAIRTPVLLVAAGQYAKDDAARAALAASYESQVSSVPEHRVVVAARARHFVMLDDPAFLFGEIDGFLAAEQGGSR